MARVLYVKESAAKKFIVVDAAMNDLLRPSLYGAYHNILPLEKKSRRGKIPADIVGPVCESGDFLGKSRFLDAEEGEILAVMSAGAYGFSMASNYNSRPRPAEVIVKGGKYFLISKRQAYKDLVSKETAVDL